MAHEDVLVTDPFWMIRVNLALYIRVILNITWVGRGEIFKWLNQSKMFHFNFEWLAISVVTWLIHFECLVRDWHYTWGLLSSSHGLAREKFLKRLNNSKMAHYNLNDRLFLLIHGYPFWMFYEVLMSLGLPREKYLVTHEIHGSSLINDWSILKVLFYSGNVLVREKYLMAQEIQNIFWWLRHNLGWRNSKCLKKFLMAYWLELWLAAIISYSWKFILVYVWNSGFK